MDEFRHIPLSQTHYTLVVASDYPWVTEWDWQYDEKLDMAYRMEGDRKILLLHEVIKRTGLDTEKPLPLVGKKTIRAIFMPCEHYRNAVYAIRICRDLCASKDWLIPTVNEFLALGLSITLARIFEWRRATGDTKHFECIQDWFNYATCQLQSGEVVSVLVPAAVDMMRVWNTFVAEYNSDKIESPREIEEYLDAKGYPIQGALSPLLLTLGTYPFVP